MVVVESWSFVAEVDPTAATSKLWFSLAASATVVGIPTARPTRGLTDKKTMRAAVAEVIGDEGVNTVARETSTDRMTLKRYVRKVRVNPGTVCKPNYITTQVFSTAEETNLSDYILQASRLHCGLSLQRLHKS